MMTSNREKEILLAVLNRYKEMPHLWQKTHKEYMNRDKREVGFKILLKIYREFDAHATIKYLKKKIENMRTSYIRELRKMKECQRTGKIYSSNLYYFDALRFIGDSDGYYAPKIEPAEIEGHSPALSSDADSDYQPKPTSSAQKKKKISQPVADTKVNNQVTTDVLLQIQDEKWDAIGRSLGLQLRDLDKDQQTVAHKLINDVMYYAESGMLSPHCSICLDTTLGHTLNIEYDSPSEESRHLDIDSMDPIIP
ncbi:unnamed protein product [Arctia plantaginis]|uniref:MADF domain-containing protein n=1 Tax=Arctia plantaginis TaxID=874455 RepID=A0A8S0Z968_ARCPL|nr:unnamed protein product [Arctia plantaginis]